MMAEWDLKLPEMYKKSEELFWIHPYISKKLLAAHLNPEFEGASRTKTYIEMSIKWIENTFPKEKYPKVLDLGCGPGLYTTALAFSGYDVTGVDISTRSIDYAKEHAKEKGLNIVYECINYLYLQIEEKFDLITMIYCDYGALSTADRKIVMQKVYQGLPKGGIFLLDVFTDTKYHTFEEYRTWEYSTKNGFWREDAYVVLQRNIKYPELVTLEESIIITNKDIQNYYIWNTYFTKETITKEAVEVGFTVISIYGDVTGQPYTKDSETICIVLEK